MMMDNPIFDHSMWTQKARAFVTRSHRHLWGKNNEDPQAFLFTKGFKNSFVKEQILGWNKFSQERPAENWGDTTGTDKKLFLPSGIVIPYIKDKQLLSVFIHPYDEKQLEKTTILPGSLTSTMMLGENKSRIILVQDIFEGLFLFQEQKQPASIMIYPDRSIPMDNDSKMLIKKADQVLNAESF